ncbi:C-type lectin domain family 4 member M-like [Argopecten irradians]|uniref:C-type lectin domain family 4 member M-like n=1 Tax=Argopecten irradians TaxID=31199 RepID=UPI003711B1BD
MEDGPLCVKVHHNSVNWDTAKTLCEQDHGQLLVLDDAKKYQAYFSHGGSDFNTEVWIGINDKDTENSWKWLNGADLDTSYWSNIQLNDYSSGYLPDQYTADCGATGGYAWLVDFHCLQKLPFTCQRIDLE